MLNENDKLDLAALAFVGIDHNKGNHPGSSVKLYFDGAVEAGVIWQIEAAIHTILGRHEVALSGPLQFGCSTPAAHANTQYVRPSGYMVMRLATMEQLSASCVRELMETLRPRYQASVVFSGIGIRNFGIDTEDRLEFKLAPKSGAMVIPANADPYWESLSANVSQRWRDLSLTMMSTGVVVITAPHMLAPELGGGDLQRIIGMLGAISL